MNRAAITFLSIISASSVISGCSARGVTRLEPEQAVDLSGRWNDEDSRLVSEAMIEQALSSGWHRQHLSSEGKKPVIIVGHVRNLTLEHINPQTFIKDLERALLNSGKAEIVASSTEREEVRAERKDMQRWASLETVKEPGAETGADYMLKGVISSILDEEGGRRVVYYQADLNLVSLRDNIVVWAGQKRIRKFIRRPLFTF